MISFFVDSTPSQMFL